MLSPVLLGVGPETTLNRSLEAIKRAASQIEIRERKHYCES